MGFNSTRCLARGMTTTGFLFYTATSLAAARAGSPARHADFSGIANANVQVLTPAECRAEYAISRLAHARRREKIVAAAEHAHGLMGLSFLSWTPDGTSGHMDTAGCEPERIERVFLNARGSTEKQAAGLREFFRRCDQNLRADAPDSLQALVNTTETEYDLCAHPNMRKVVIRVPGGDLIRGILALKPGQRPRPLVISKCGVLCDVGDSSMRWMLMHLYDESPFNVLALANNSGSDFIRDNGYFAPGGFQEGQQVIQVAKMMKQGELGSRISSTHFVGVSLGSHAGLFASLINPYNAEVTPAGDVLPLASSLVACPVVDLHEAMVGLFQTPIKSFLARMIFDNVVSRIVTTLPGLHTLFNTWDDLDTEDLPAEIARQSVNHYRKVGNAWQLPPFRDVKIRTDEDFWKANSFLEVAARATMSTPTFVIAADDDEIVDTSKNAGALAPIVAKIRRALAGVAGAPKENLDAVILKSGDHCAFSQIYGWKTASALYRSHVIANSPELIAQRRVETAHFPTSYDHADRVDFPWGRPRRYTTVFKFEAGVASLRVTSRFFTGSTDTPYSTQDGCSRPIQGAPEYCFNEVVMNIPFAQLSPRPSWARAPSTQAEAEGLTRWANVQMKILSQKGTVLDESSQDAEQLRWISYEN